MANYDDTNGVWRTIGGRRVFIKTGQSISEAMKESGKFTKKQIKKKEDYVTEPGKAKKESAEQIEKDFPDNLSDEVKEQARLLNTRSYDDIDDVIDDFAEEQGITRNEAKYALLKDEFKQRQGAYIDAKEDGSYSDAELNHMESMAKDSYFKLQEAKEQLDSFNKENNALKSNVNPYGKERLDSIKNALNSGELNQEQENNALKDFRKISGGKRPDEVYNIEDGKYTTKKETSKLTSESYNKGLDEQYQKLKNGEIDYKEYKKTTDDLMDRYYAQKGSSKTYKASDLEEGKPYEIDMGNGIKKTAIYIGKDEDGNSSFYDGEGVSGTFGFSDKFINDRLKISDNTDDDKFMELHNQIVKKSKNPSKSGIAGNLSTEEQNKIIGREYQEYFRRNPNKTWDDFEEYFYGDKLKENVDQKVREYDWVRNAFNQYKKDHPKSKIMLAEFTKKNKK